MGFLLITEGYEFQIGTKKKKKKLNFELSQTRASLAKISAASTLYFSAIGLSLPEALSWKMKTNFKAFHKKKRAPTLLAAESTAPNGY